MEPRGEMRADWRAALQSAHSVEAALAAAGAKRTGPHPGLQGYVLAWTEPDASGEADLAASEAIGDAIVAQSRAAYRAREEEPS